MRGFLFTVALVSTALVITSLALFIMQSGQMERSNTVALAVFDRMRNDVLCIGSGFKDIVNAAGLNITVDNYTVSITEELPNPNEANYTANIDNWRDFAGNHSSFPVKVSVQGIRDNLPLAMRPSQVIYDHPNGLGGDTISVHNTSQVVNYTIDLYVDTNEAFSFNWGTINDDPPGLGFHIFVSNNSVQEERMQQLDPDQTTTLTITTASGDFTFDIGSSIDKGLLVISNPSDLNATLITNTTLSATKNPTIMFPYEVISLVSTISNASTTSAVWIE
jgi:hypothetical protein